MRFHIYIWLFLTLCLILVFEGTAQQHPFVRYGVKDGFLHNHITGITQDYRGFLWVATQGTSLSRFDGQNVVIFSAPASELPTNINVLASDYGNYIFAGGSNGVCCIRLSPDLRDRTDQALNEILKIVRDSVIEMYMRSPQELYIRALQQAWTFSLHDSLLHSSPVLPLRHAYLENFYSDREIRAISRGCDKRIWLATNSGLLMHDDADGFVYDRHNGLLSDDVHSVYADNEGNIWAGTIDGLFRLTPYRLENFLPGSELDSDVTGVLSILSTHTDVVWAGTRGGGLAKLFDGERRIFRMRDGLPSDNVNALLELPNGDILVGTDNGVAVIADNQITSMEHVISLPDQKIEALYRSSDGRYWIASQSGLTVWDGNKTRVYDTNDGLPKEPVRCMVEDGYGFIALGTYAGLYRINLRNGNIIPSQGVGKVVVTSLYVDDQQRLWIGTMGDGVFWRDSYSPRMRRISQNDGLTGNTVHFVVSDSYGSMYFGSNSGVSVLPAGVLEYLVDEETRRFGNNTDPVIVRSLLRPLTLYSIDSHTGLAGDMMNAGAACRDAQNRLWFGSNGGVSCYTPRIPLRRRNTRYSDCRDSTDTAGRVRIWIDNIFINNTLTPRRSTIVFGPYDKTLRIRVLVPSFHNPESITILYRLEGYDYTWRKCSDNEILYSTLPPGNYTLLLRAGLGEGEWTAVHRMVSIVVEAPFTDTIFFRLLLFFAVAGLGALLMYHFSRKHIENEKNRFRIAAETIEDVSDSLGSIYLLSDPVRRWHESTAVIDRHTVHTLTRSCILDLSDIIWAANKDNDRMTELTRRLQSTANRLAQETGITIRFDVSNVHPTQKSDGTVRHAVMIITKEVLDNVLRHSGATQIRICIRRHRQKWSLTIEDDGHGFDTMARYPGRGLRRISSLAWSLHWDLVTHSSPEGTTTTLWFPV